MKLYRIFLILLAVACLVMGVVSGFVTDDTLQPLVFVIAGNIAMLWLYHERTNDKIRDLTGRVRFLDRELDRHIND